MRKFALILVFLLTFSSVYSQNPTLSRTEALADLDSLSTWIKDVHPDPFTVLPEEEFDRQIGLLKSGLPDSLSSFELYKRAAPLVVRLGDGHTGMWEPHSFWKGETSTHHFPYLLKITPDACSLLLEATGEEIISINDVSSEDIIKTALQYSPGEKLHFRIVTLSPSMHLYITTLYESEVYKLVLKSSDQIRTEYVAAVAAEQLPPITMDEDRIPYNYEIIVDGRAMLFEFNSFVSPDEGEYERFLEDMFTELKERKIPNLIIDIRNNGGGWSGRGDQLLQYISPQPFQQFGDITVRISRKWNEVFENNEEIQLFRHTDTQLTELRDNPLRYAENGNIYLLTSAFSFSSATDFAWAFQYFKVGEIVGEETGGLVVTFGDVLPVSLPHSGLRCGISWKKFYSYGTTDENIHGVIPDFAVPAEEALQFVLDKIEQNSETKN